MTSATATEVRVPGGRAHVGSDRFYPEESPPTVVEVGDVWFDRTPVTNRQFARFVAETGHVTVAETAPDAADLPGADPALLVPGSLCFAPPPGPVALDDWTRWWVWRPGASWRCPQQPDQPYTDLLDHPVVHVGWEDAAAYARWAGRDLPTEAEWEHAARGGRAPTDYAWGAELTPSGRRMANTWHGGFPWEDTDPDGFTRTSPVGCYPAGGFGLRDMIGNVWEWTATPWTDSHAADGTGHGPGSCCGPLAGTGTDRMVSKGGSHLCSPAYCQRYRPAARQGHGIRDAASHLGFRTVRREQR